MQGIKKLTLGLPDGQKSKWLNVCNVCQKRLALMSRFLAMMKLYTQSFCMYTAKAMVKTFLPEKKIKLTSCYGNISSCFDSSDIVILL